MCLCEYLVKIKMFSKSVHTLNVFKHLETAFQRDGYYFTPSMSVLCLKPLPTIYIHSFKMFADLIGKNGNLLLNLHFPDNYYG